MDYLKQYGLDDNQIKTIISIIKRNDIDLDKFIFYPEKVKEILDMFIEIGADNVYEIIITNPRLFLGSVKLIKDKINNYPDKYELGRLIKEDPINMMDAYLM